MKKFLIFLTFLTTCVINTADSKAQLLNNQLVTSRQEFPGFSHIDLYLNPSNLFYEYSRSEFKSIHNCDNTNIHRKSRIFVLSNEDYEYKYHQRLELTDLKCTSFPIGHIRENCSGFSVLPNNLKLKALWDEYPMITFSQNSYQINSYLSPKVAAIKFNIMNEIKNNELTWYVHHSDNVAFFWRSMMCMNIKKSGSEYTATLRYHDISTFYLDHHNKVYFDFYAKWTAKELVS